MADYLAEPLWSRSATGAGACSMSLDGFSLSAELKRRLRDWAARYDALMQTGYEWPDPAYEAVWIADGRALLEAVRTELGPDYDVEYFDETSRRPSQ